MDLEALGRLLALLGVSLALVGGLLWLGGRLGLGALPGNLRFNGQGWSCFVPITASILISLLLTLVLNVVLRLLNR